MQLLQASDAILPDYTPALITPQLRLVKKNRIVAKHFFGEHEAYRGLLSKTLYVEFNILRYNHLDGSPAWNTVSRFSFRMTHCLYYRFILLEYIGFTYYINAASPISILRCEEAFERREPLHTIRDVARLAGVSVATTSKVLNKKGSVSPKLTQRVLSAVQALDYHPDQVARSLKAGQTQTIGILIPDITNPFFTDVIRGVENEARVHGYSLILTDSNEDPAL